MTFMRIGEKPEIARLPLFRDMDDAMRERIFSGSFLQVFPPQLTLFEVGQRADFLHVLVDGAVELYAAGGGRDTTMRIVEPVTSYILAAVINDMPYLMSARTLASSRILLVPAALMREVIKQDTALMQATMHELALGYRDLVRALTDMKLRQSAERLEGSGAAALQTPLATLHAFNGWADKFLITPTNGLRDLYVDAGYKVAGASPLKGLTVRAIYHDFDSTRANISYGSEWNALIAYPLNKTLVLSAKFARYDAASFATDTTKAWFSAEVKF